MPVETGTTIASLDDLWPLSGDYIQDGDNHLRLIKTVLKAAFPGIGGDGFATPIAATEAEINFLAGVTSGIQAQLDVLSAVSGVEIPAGTIMLFYQAAAPVGWTQIANDDNSMLRVVSGVGGGSGGSDSPIDLTVAAHVHTTSAHALTIAEIPTHDHTVPNKDCRDYTSIYGYGTGNYNTWCDTSGVVSGGAEAPLTSPTGSGDTHEHGDTSSESGFTFAPRYIDVIQASKDA